MSLSVGIVGLPNVGKSTLFNALLKKQLAYAANFPFATIEPNVGVVPVPDARLPKLAEAVKVSENLDKLPPVVPSTVTFIDIAGLISGAHKGEGLGNKFLSHIREADAVLHVIRAFEDENIVKEGTVDPLSDLSVIETELLMADYATLEKQKEIKGNPTREEKERWSAVTKVKAEIEKGNPARSVQLNKEQEAQIRQLTLLSNKPILVALNCDEKTLQRASVFENEFALKANLKPHQVVALNAKLEEDLAGLSDNDRLIYLAGLGMKQDGLERIITKAFSTLSLISFLTAGVKEVRSWTVKKGIRAQYAAGTIHTDFVKHFIRADVIAFDDFIALQGWKSAREAGKVRSEGRDYTVSDGDVIEFKIGT